MRKVTNEVHNGLANPQMSGSSMRERMTVANLALHSLADIEDESQETLKYIKQEDASIWNFNEYCRKIIQRVIRKTK